MPLSHPAYPHSSGDPQLVINPVFTCEPVHIPRNRLPPAALDPDIAYQVVGDQLMLDGNARLNLATFRTVLDGAPSQPIDDRVFRQEPDRQG
jgi:glutamate decarboxylase